MVTQPFRLERWRNFAETTLNGAVSGGAGSITVTSAALFPTAGDFRLLLSGTEEVTVKSVSGTTFTLVANTAGAHSNGATVQLVASADGVDDAFQQAFGDSDYPFNRILNGATTLTASSFTWLNQGSATCTDADDGGLNMTLPSEANDQIRGKYIAAPGTPWTVVMRAEFGPGFADTSTGTYMGILLRESSSGELYVFGLRPDRIDFRRFTNVTTYSADVGTFVYNNNQECWLKLTDNGTNLIGEISYDGKNWLSQFSEGRTSFMAGGPDQVGFCGSSGSGASGLLLHFKSWILE